MKSLLFFIIFLLSISSYAGVTFMGARVIRDQDFYGNTQDIGEFNKGYIDRPDIGARFEVYFLNDGEGDDMEVTGCIINGVDFDNLTADTWNTGMGTADGKWWAAWPEPVPNNYICAVKGRVNVLSNDIPVGSTFTLKTNKGNFDYTDFASYTDSRPHVLWIPSVNVNSNGTRLTIFIANAGNANITIPATGGVKVNGTDVSTWSGVTVHVPAQRTLRPGESAPVSVTGISSAYADEFRLDDKYRCTVFEVQDEEGHVACGALRVTPYTGGVWAHQIGGTNDDKDWYNHHFKEFADIGEWEVMDEPITRMSPRQMWEKARDIMQSDNWNATRLMKVHNTKYTEGLVYNGTSWDLVTTHSGDRHFDLSVYTTWPNPVWYTPQCTWANYEGMYLKEKWDGVENAHFQAFKAIGGGAKCIEWFLHQSHWRRGFGFREATDFARIYQDRTKGGHISNPILWNYLGRVGGVIQAVAEYIAFGAPSSEGQRDGVQWKLLASNPEADTYAALVVLADARTPAKTAFRPFDYGVPEYDQRLIAGYTASIPLPDYLYNSVDKIAVIDPVMGFVSLGSLEKTTGGVVRFTIPEISTAAMCVFDTEARINALSNTWYAEYQPHLDGYEDLSAVMLSRAQKNTEEEWEFPEYHYRMRLVVTNTGTESAAHFAIKLPLDLSRDFDGTHFRTREKTASGYTDVPYFIAGDKVYEDFTENYTGRMPTVNYPWSLIHHDDNIVSLGTDYSYEPSQTREAFYLTQWPLPGQPEWSGSTYPGPMPECIERVYPWCHTSGDDGNMARVDVYDTVMVEARNSEYYEPDYAALRIEWRAKKIPEPTSDSWFWDARYFVGGGKMFYSNEETLKATQDIGDGYNRYVFDAELALQKSIEYASWAVPDRNLSDGWYRVMLHVKKPASGAALTGFSYVHYKRIILSGRKLHIHTATPLAAGDIREYMIYYDVKDNNCTAATPATYDTSLGTSTYNSAVIAVSIEKGVAAPATCAIAGNNITLEGQADSIKAVVRHIGIDGSLVSTKTVGYGSPQRTFNTTLTRPMYRGELLTVIFVQPGGDGHVFTFNCNGIPVEGHPQACVIKPDVWQSDPWLKEWKAYETPEPWHYVWPDAMAMTRDGKRVAAGTTTVHYDSSNFNTVGWRTQTDPPEEDTTGYLRMYDDTGNVQWEKSFDGKIMHIAFAHEKVFSNSYLYVTACDGEQPIWDNAADSGLFRTKFTNVRIYRYRTTDGQEMWSKQITDGVTCVPTSGVTWDPGRSQSMCLDVYDNGDVVYGEWYGHIIRRSAADGSIVWVNDDSVRDASMPFHPMFVGATSDGGAIARGIRGQHILNDGTVKPTDIPLIGSVGTQTQGVPGREYLAMETNKWQDPWSHSVATTTNAGLWAMAGNHVQIINDSGAAGVRAEYADGSPKMMIYAGRYPRVMQFSPDGQYLAIGACDGTFSFLDTQATTPESEILWQKKNGRAFVSDIAFVPESNIVLCAWEIFDYRHSNYSTYDERWIYREAVQAYDYSGNPLWRSEGTWHGQPFMAQIAVSDDGTKLAVLNHDRLRYVDTTAQVVSNDVLYPVDDYLGAIPEPGMGICVIMLGAIWILRRCC